MISLANALPQEVWTLVYEFDPTYRKQLCECHSELRKHVSVLLRFSEPFERIVRCVTKSELVQLSTFLHIKVPKHTTKKQLVWGIYYYLKRPYVNL